MPEATRGGRTLVWREAGHGAPALLLHCILAHSGAWSGVMARLGDLLAVRAPDLPGHGGTSHDPRIDLHDAATADAGFLLADGDPAHVIGHSFGAIVALRLAVEAPARVASLTLIEPVLFALLAETDPAAYAAEVAADAETNAALDAGDWARARDGFLARWGAGGALTPERAAELEARMVLVAASRRAIGDPATAVVHHRNLGRIACPVLLIGGAASSPVIGSILDGLEAGLPLSRRVTIPGAGHMVPITHPDPVSDAIAAFLTAQKAKETIDFGCGG